MINVNGLKGKIVERGLNIEKLSVEIGVNRATIYRKLNGKDGSEFTVGEVAKIAKVLKLNYSEVNSIFFPEIIADMR